MFNKVKQTLTIREKLEKVRKKYKDIDKQEKEKFEKKISSSPFTYVFYQAWKTGNMSLLKNIDYSLLDYEYRNLFNKFHLMLLTYEQNPILHEFDRNEGILLASLFHYLPEINKPLKWFIDNDEKLERLVNYLQEQHGYNITILDLIGDVDYLTIDDFKYLLEKIIKYKTPYPLITTIQSFIKEDKMDELMVYLQQFKENNIVFLDTVVSPYGNIKNDVLPTLKTINHLLKDGFPIGVKFYGIDYKNMFKNCKTNEEFELFFTAIISLLKYVYSVPTAFDRLEEISIYDINLFGFFYHKMLKNKNISSDTIQNINKMFINSFKSEFSEEYLEILLNYFANEEVIPQQLPQKLIPDAHMLFERAPFTPFLNLNKIFGKEDFDFIIDLPKVTVNGYNKVKKMMKLWDPHKTYDIFQISKERTLPQLMYQYINSNNFSFKFSHNMYINSLEEFIELRNKLQHLQSTFTIQYLILSEKEIDILANFYINYNDKLTTVDNFFISLLLANYYYLYKLEEIVKEGNRKIIEYYNRNNMTAK